MGLKGNKMLQILTTEVDDTPEERKFIIKLDLIVVPYAVLAYWVKYIGSMPCFPFLLWQKLTKILYRSGKLEYVPHINLLRTAL